LIANLGTLNQLIGIFNNTLDLNDELVVTLIGVVLPHPLRRNDHPDVISVCTGLDGSHRRRKISDIQFPTQPVRDRGFDEINHQVRTLLANISPCTGIAEVDYDAPFAILAATEHHITNRMLCSDQALLGKASGACSRRIRHTLNREQRYIKGLAVDTGLVIEILDQIKDQAGAVTDLHDIHTAQVPLVEYLGIFAQPICCRLEVEGNFCGIGHAESRRRCR